MKVEMIKHAGGILAPANDEEAQKLTAIKTGDQYTFEYKRMRNPHFHKKAFAFINFCFEHWAGNEFQDSKEQKETFRKNLLVLAGYREQTYKIDGSVRVEAKSMSYGAMDQDEFESCYHALIQAAMRHVFKTADEKTYNQLLSFF